VGLFKHLPVTSLEAVTENFEQLEAIIQRLEGELADAKRKAGGK
jgi:hypothetical protein